MTQDEGIDIAVRLSSAIYPLKAALESAEKTDGAPVERIREARQTVIDCRLACLKDIAFLRQLLL